MNQQIVDYIKQARQSGMSDASIRQQLLTSGWPEAEVSETFNMLSQIPQMPMATENFSAQPRKINVKKMITKGILGIFAGLAFGLIIGGIIGAVLKISFGIPFFAVWILTIFLFGLWGAKSKTKEEEKAELQKAVVSEEGLTTNEKIAAWIFSILNPVITGAIMYYMWRKRYPTKAKKANHISMIVFVLELALGIFIAIATSK